jgi:hypothetical protein
MQDMLVDRRGRVWLPPVLARHYRYRYPSDLSLASFAVRERGFIHVRRRVAGVEIALRAGKFTQRGLLAAILALEQIPVRIVLSVFDGARWTHELFASMVSFTRFAEVIAADEPLGPRELWTATRLPLTALSQPRFASLRPLVSTWEACRGRLPDDFDRYIAELGHQPRTILLQRKPRSKRLVFEHVPIGSQMMKPDQWLKYIGHSLAEMPDPQYSAWAHRTYSEVVASERPQLDSVRANTRSLDGAKLHMRYDRLLVPWRGRGSTVFVNAVTVRRELSITP